MQTSTEREQIDTNIHVACTPRVQTDVVASTSAASGPGRMQTSHKYLYQILKFRQSHPQQLYHMSKYIHTHTHTHV